METLELLALTHNTYSLITLLKDYILSSDISKNTDRKLTGLISFTEALEQNLYNIKISLESSLTIQGK